MKPKFLLFLIISFASLSSYATHYRGAEITHKLLDASTHHFEVNVITYQRNPTNADRYWVHLNWGDGELDSIVRSNGPLDSAGNHMGEICENGITKSVYTGTHHYGIPPQPYPGHIVVSFLDINRIDGITNIASGQSVNVPMYVEDTLFIAHIIASGTNTSPQFEICQPDYANLMDPYTTSPAVYDADGDSLYFELVTPLEGSGMHVPQYSFPDVYCQSNGQSNSQFQINHHIGQISWTPLCTQGIFSVAVLVKEFRCGVLLSTIMRDFQIVVLNEVNITPFISQVTDTVIQPGDSISLTLTAADANNPQIVSFHAYGDALTLQQNAAVFQTTPDNPATAVFNWQTTASTARHHAYIVTIRAVDNYTSGNSPVYSSDFKTFRIWVADTSACSAFTDIHQQQESDFNFTVYPNPFFEEIQLSAPIEIETAVLTDISGRILLTQQPFSRQHFIKTETLAAGVYFIAVSTAKGKAIKQLVKQ